MESERERSVHTNQLLASVSRDMDESPAIAVLNSESAQLPLTSLIVSEHSHNDAISGHLLHAPTTSVTLPNSSSSPPPFASMTGHMKSTTGTMCIVCGDVAPKDTTFRRHYGVVCCEACKCFFRRTVQMSRDYKCRYGGTCSIGRNPVSMKQVCQACRFTQCIKAGMRLESVKRFPRKGREDRKYHKELKLGKGKKMKAKDGGGSSDEIATTNGTARGSPTDNVKSERGESDAEFETDLEHLKFGVASPESFMYSVLDSAVPQLFNYDSLENIHERSGGGAGGSPLRETGEGSRTGSNSNLSHGNSVPRLVKAGSSGSINKKALGEEGLEGRSSLLSKRSAPHELHNALQIQGKKMKLESALSVITPRQPIASYSSSSSAPPSRSQSLSQPPSIVNSPESMVGTTSAYNSQETTPYATPIGTPAHSPLPSPTHTLSQHSHHHVPHLVQKFPHSPVFSTSSGATLPGHMTHRVSTTSFATPTHPATTVNIPAFSQSSNSFLLHGQTNTGTIFLNHPSQMPFRVLPVAGVTAHPPLVPLVHFAPFSQQTLATDMELMRQDISPTLKKSPFTIIPIPSVNRAQPEEPEVFTSFIISQDRDAPRAGDCEDVGMMSAPPSARASPEPREPVHRTRSLAAMPEAELEEVLDSLRLRIRSMFKWAKSEVAGFEDLSPLDQKALLRRTVAELVMLGFARGSIAYDNMLLLGRTDKVIRVTNPNTGVASVASITLQRLVVPLKVLNINDRELTLLKEIVLFNPESTGLRNREVVRQYRKRKHIELMEYTVKNSGEPGRFGELMCLLTPLFEVSTEVTEQLRLEQFVYEGEARIDALLLMSMINGAEETTESVADA